MDEFRKKKQLEKEGLTEGGEKKLNLTLKKMWNTVHNIKVRSNKIITNITKIYLLRYCW